MNLLECEKSILFFCVIDVENCVVFSSDTMRHFHCCMNAKDNISEVCIEPKQKRKKETYRFFISMD